jgi:L-alanine-DL-glutamate epimerase-like enolase superfamily enzyme
MNDTVRRARKLTGAQVRIILDWHARYVASQAVGRRVA